MVAMSCFSMITHGKSNHSVFLSSIVAKSHYYAIRSITIVSHFAAVSGFIILSSLLDSTVDPCWL